MKSLNKFLLPCLLIIVASCNNRPKIGYVNIGKLYESFEYKKELSNEYNKVKMARKRICDSLDNEINIMANQIETEKLANAEIEKEFDGKRKNLFQLNKQYDEDNQVLLETYDVKILKQLNAYIKEYGEKNGYEILFGADSKGSILFGSEQLDETEKLIAFVNKRYKGEKISD